MVTALSDAEYTSRADVFVSAPSSGVASDAEGAAAYSQEQAKNFAELASRQVVLLPVIDDLGLDLTSSEVRNGLNVSVPLDTSIISIRTTDTDPDRAAKVANAIGESLAGVVRDLRGVDPLTFQMIERAEPASSASSPRPVLNVLIGILVGICVGAGLISLRGAAKPSSA